MKKTKWLLAMSAMAGSLTLSSPASAAPLLYSFTGLPGLATNFSFKVESNPFPFSADQAGFQSAIFDNVGYGSGTKFVRFYSASYGGGFGDFLGAQLYSGHYSAPTLLTGVFALTNTSKSPRGTLTVSAVSAVAAAVPEPGTWAMMLVGFGLVGGMARMQRRRVTVAWA